MSSAPVARLRLVRIRKVIPAGLTITFDSVKNMKGAKYMISSWSDALTEVKRLDLSIVTIGSETRDSVSNRNGNLPLIIVSAVTGSDTIVVMTNPNAFNVTVEAFRFATI